MRGGSLCFLRRHSRTAFQTILSPTLHREKFRSNFDKLAPVPSRELKSFALLVGEAEKRCKPVHVLEILLNSNEMETGISGAV
jgi:hypothetical protein